MQGEVIGSCQGICRTAAQVALVEDGEVCGRRSTTSLDPSLFLGDLAVVTTEFPLISGVVSLGYLLQYLKSSQVCKDPPMKNAA